jgi:addiction module HigA family antidote
MNNPSHPGRILAYFLGDRSVTEVARHLGVTRSALARVLKEKSAISGDMALRLAEAFKTEPELWLRLQMKYDLFAACQQKRARIKSLETDLAA